MVLNVDNVFENTAEDAADEYFIQEAEQALRPRIVIKLVDEGQTTTTLQDDDELFMSLSAECTYEFELNLLLKSNPTSNIIKYTFSAPTNAIGVFNTIISQGSPITVNLNLTSFGSNETDELGNSFLLSTIKGWVKTGNTTGNLQFKWAVSSSSGGDTITVGANSYMKVTRQ